jgi:ADP-ribosyl-[dinitrogen reductase] hydrolase
MSRCPGAGIAHGGPESERQLSLDVGHIAAQGVQTVVSLLDTVELKRLGAKNLPHHLALNAMAWHQLPVVDFGVPTQAVTSQWQRLMPHLTQVLQNGNILIHCAHGKGRTGTLVATLFMAWGWSAEAAIARVRQYRPGAIETHKQQAYVEAFDGAGALAPC